MTPNEFYQEAKSNNLTLNEVQHVHVVESSKLGVTVDIHISFDLKHSLLPAKFNASVATVLFDDISTTQYNRIVHNAKQQSSSEKVQIMLAAKELLSRPDAVIMLGYDELLSHPAVSKHFNLTEMKTYSGQDIGVATVENIEHQLRQIEKVYVATPRYLEESLAQEEIINNFDVKKVSAILEETNDIISEENSNNTSDYPDNISKKVEKVIAKWKVLEPMTYNCEERKANLVQSLEHLKVMSNRHYIFHDDMTRREAELNGGFDDPSEEEYAESARDDSTRDFDENRSEHSTAIDEAAYNFSTMKAAAAEMYKQKHVAPSNNNELSL